MTPGMPLFTPGSPNPGTSIGAPFSVVVLNTGKNFVIPLLGPYASSIRYTATRHQASNAENIQKYAATLIPTPTPFPYAKRQQAIVVPMASAKRRVARITSRAVAAIACFTSQISICSREEEGGEEITYTNPSKRSQHHKPRRQLRKMSMNIASRQRSSRIQQKHQPLTHPKSTPPKFISTSPFLPLLLGLPLT